VAKDVAYFEQVGYDTWVEYWSRQGATPPLHFCPAIHMKPESEERGAVIRGWLRAQNESHERPSN
jgi:hypothetical protein